MTCTCNTHGVNINLNSRFGDTQFKRLELLLGKVLMNQAELAAKLNANADQLSKVGAEVQNLLNVVATQQDVSPELQAAADRVEGAIQAVDTLIPDAQS